MEALYPFLYSDASDLADLKAEVRESTLAKAREIAELRNVVAARE
jgi:D-sedoheptulose 7-phosphate isomerase